jgi:hypothetical protein
VSDYNVNSASNLPAVLSYKIVEICLQNEGMNEERAKDFRRG